MIIITKEMWSHVIAEDKDFLDRLKKRLTLDITKNNGENTSVLLYKEVIPNFYLDIPTGIVDTMVLPYVNFQTTYDERTTPVNIDIKQLLDKVKKVYDEMHEASPNFEVREHQLMGSLKCLIAKRGICEAATGCFVGSTVILLNNCFETIENLSKDFKDKEVFCSDGKPHKIKNAFISKYVKDTVVLTFNDGMQVECTPDHRFLLTNGQYKEAIDLIFENTVAGVYGERVVTHIKTNHYCNPIPVYDIEVDNELHNFALSNGVIVHNSGKTEIISSLLNLIEGKILIINNRTNILNQIESRAKSRGISRKIEYLNKSSNLEDSDVIISTNNLIWNMIKKGDEKAFEYLKTIKAIIVDECQHGSCQSIAVPVMIANPEYLIGFTASPYKDNGNCIDDILLNAIFGNSFYYISSKYLRDKGYSAYVYSHYLNYPITTSVKKCRTCTEVYKRYIAENFNRNEVAYKCIKEVYDAGLKILVMVSLIDHGTNIIRELKSLGIKSLFMCGGNTIYEATDEKEKIKGITVNKIVKKKGNAETIKKAIREEDYRVIVGNVVFNEGIDVPEFDVGLLLDAGKNVISHVQRIGRVCRRKENGLNCAIFVDFNDKGHPYIESWTKERKEHLVKEGIPTINELQYHELIQNMGKSKITKSL